MPAQIGLRPSPSNAISSKVMALTPACSLRRTTSSRTRPCWRDSFLGSESADHIVSIEEEARPQSRRSASQRAEVSTFTISPVILTFPARIPLGDFHVCFLVGPMVATGRPEAPMTRVFMTFVVLPIWSPDQFSEACDPPHGPPRPDKGTHPVRVPRGVLQSDLYAEFP